jgi:hypothetical protein
MVAPVQMALPALLVPLVLQALPVPLVPVAQLVQLT